MKRRICVSVSIIVSMRFRGMTRSGRDCWEAATFSSRAKKYSLCGIFFVGRPSGMLIGIGIPRFLFQGCVAALHAPKGLEALHSVEERLREASYCAHPF